MDCKNTSTKQRARRRCLGFTLPDLLVTTGVGSVVTAAVLATSAFAGRSFYALINYAVLETKSRTALDTLSLDVRQMEYLTNFSTTFISSPYAPAGVVTNQIAFAPFKGATSNQWVRYTYDPFQRTLTRSSNNAHRVLLTGCEFLNFGLYQRNQINGEFTPIPTTDPRQVKLIEVQWVCLRHMLGGAQSRTNSESVQSAKFVIRRK
jgi:hypothetical protein